VFGAAEDCAFEWFVWHDGNLMTSDRGYSSITCALRDALIQLGG
jgi:hypothetical protein